MKRGTKKAPRRQKEDDKKTSLLSAVRHSSKELVQALLEDGDEMKTDDNGATLLMIALREGNVGAVELLLGRKEIEDKDADSNNVFHYALGSLKVKDVTQLPSGSVLAARFKDGAFHRAVLRTVLPHNSLVRLEYVDYGTVDIQ